LGRVRLRRERPGDFHLVLPKTELERNGRKRQEGKRPPRQPREK
jgi:hypothetical protein